MMSSRSTRELEPETGTTSEDPLSPDNFSERAFRCAVYAREKVWQFR